MQTQDLFSENVAQSIPIKLFGKRPASKLVSSNGQAIPSSPEEKFVPVVLAQAPDAVLSMPESSLDEKICKTLEVFKWLLTSFETCFGLSGKDSSTCVALALYAAKLLRQQGQPVKRFAICSADTLQENPEVLSVIQGELVKIQQWIDDYDLPGEVKVTTPSLASQYMVSIIGGKSIISTPMTNSQCTTDLKSRPLTKARIEMFGRNDVAKGKFVVTVTGMRFSESERRRHHLEARSESPVQVVMTDADQNVFIAPIAMWDSDAVMEFIGLAVNQMLPFGIYTDMVDLWRVYKDAEGECQVGRGDKPSKGCSARHGCWSCTMVSADASMTAMVQDDKYSYMKPLAELRTYLLNTLFDLNRRTWVGRSIIDGHIAFRPDAYAPGELQNLLRYALTIDVQEQEEAARMGIKPRFQIISLEALFAICAQWSLQGFALPHAGLKIYRDVYINGERFPVPQVEPFPKVPIPEARWIKVGDTWDSDAYNAIHTGLRDPLGEMTSFNGVPCMGHKTITRGGQQHTVLDVNTDDVFSVDAESAMMILQFELDRLVDQYHGAGAKGTLLGSACAVRGYLFYVQYGVLSVAPSQLSMVDEILRRTSWRERLGLAGHNYCHETAQLMSIERDQTEISRSRHQQETERAAQRVKLDRLEAIEQKRLHLARCLTVTQLYRDWAPDVPWRQLIQAKQLVCYKGPAAPAGSGRTRPTARKCWAMHHLVRAYSLLVCIKSNPDIQERVKAHRSAARKKGFQMDLLKAA